MGAELNILNFQGISGRKTGEDSMEFMRAKRESVPPGDIVRGLVAFREDRRLFEIATWIGGDTYEIEADRILTHKAFTDWVWQLQEKGWMTGQHFDDFFQCLSDFIYRQYGTNPQTFYEVHRAGSDMDSV